MSSSIIRCASVLLVAGAAAFANVRAAQALPVVYDESVNGDLSGADPLAILPLDVGINTISGTLTISTPADFDSFAFTVPAGAFVQSAQISMADLLSDFGSIGLRFRVGSSFNAGTLLESFVSGSPGVTPITSTPGPGVYHIHGTSMGGSGPLPITVSYTFTFVLAADTIIPEPALGLLGMAGLTLRRRRMA